MSDEDDGWPRPGDRVGPYVLRERVDDGDWDRSYIADGDGDLVALRMFPVPTLIGAPVRARLVRAMGDVVLALRGVAHPAIRVVHAAGGHGDLWWIATAPDDGVPLRDWCGSCSWPEVIAVLGEVGAALGALEDAGIVADAMIPDDIRVGADGRARVDAGLGMMIGVYQPHDVLRADLVRYLTPEQLLEVPRSPRAMQHKLCVFAWEALHGRLPFTGESVAGYLLAVLDGRVADPPAGTIVPDAIREVLLRGLAVDPAARWPSMAALVAALAARGGPLARRFDR